MPRKTNTVISMVPVAWSQDRRERVPSVTTPEVVGEDVGLERDDRDDDEHQDRHDLGDGDDVVDDRRVLDTTQDQVAEQPHADQRDDHREHRVPGAERGQHRAHRRRDEHPVGGIARTRRRPVPDRRVESDVVAEPRLGIGEDAGVQIGLAHRQTLKDEGQHQHSGARDGPRDDRAEHTRLGAEPAGQQEHARPDHRADHHRGQCRAG